MNRTARAPDLARIATVGVVGAGFMGAQLALHIATRGYPVAVVDQSMDALRRMRRGHEEELDRHLGAEALSATERTAVLERIRASSDLAASFGNVDLVIEAVPERLDLNAPSSRSSTGFARRARSWRRTAPQSESRTLRTRRGPTVS